MSDNIQYFVSPERDGFEAVVNGQKIGEITFVRVGADKLIIDYTAVAPGFRNRHIGLTLVRNVVNMARVQHRRVVALCPFARAMFNRFPEFDDIRLMNMH
jgi:predicted GNAT family acetyltransferase